MADNGYDRRLIKDGTQLWQDPGTYGGIGDVQNLLNSTDPERVARGGEAFTAASSLLGEVSTFLRAAGWTMDEHWRGEDARAAQQALRRLQATAAELSYRTGQVGSSLTFYGGEMLPWYRDHAVDYGTFEFDDELLGGALSFNDDKAREHLTNLNTRIAEAYNALPDMVERHLPNADPGGPGPDLTDTEISDIGADGLGGGGLGDLGGAGLGPSGLGTSGLGPSGLGPSGLDTDGLGPSGLDTGGLGTNGPGGLDTDGLDPGGLDPDGPGTGVDTPGLPGTTTPAGLTDPATTPGASGLTDPASGLTDPAAALDTGDPRSTSLAGYESPTLTAPNSTATGVGPTGLGTTGPTGTTLAPAGTWVTPAGAGGGALASGAGLAARTDAGRGLLGGVPFMPYAGGGLGEGAQDRERSTWLSEDESVWGADPDAAPPVIT
ncbi:hypothetical protein [Thermocatellispora tengchongensis]|uniref:hypothetical protein n=1 Tax=Thermocatellispora tengchongensis TaxID=1073253 RepID=UPI003632C28D